MVESIREYFYPDLVVTCLEPIVVEPKPVSLTNPQVIIEVLSESTERYDRGDKWSAYRMIPTLTDYVMISSMRRELDHYQRGPNGTWTLRTISQGGSCTLSNGVALDLTKLYRQVPGLA
jgi:Uma2 family endonuclease